MSEEKKIIFSAEDKVSQQTNKIYSGIIGQAQKYTSSLKEQVSYINQQIKALEKKGEIEKKNNEAIINELKKQSRSAAPGLVKNQFNQTIRDERTARGARENELSEAVNLLKELLNETKRGSTASEKTEKEIVKEEQKRSKYEGLRSSRVEARSDPKGIRSKFAIAESTGYGNMSSADIEKLHYQKGIVDKESKPSVYKDIFSAMMMTGAMNNITQAVRGVISSPTGDQAINALVGQGSAAAGGAISAIGGKFGPLGAIISGLGQGVADMLGMSTESKYALAPGFQRMKARSGGVIGLGGNVDLGYNSMQAQGLQEGLLGAAGSSNNIDKLTSQAQTMMRGSAFSENTLVQIAKVMKSIGSSNDIVGLASQVMKYNPDLGGRNKVQFEQIAQVQLGLLQTLQRSTETVNQKAVSGLIGGLRSAGGNLSNSPEYLTSVANSINSNLINPSNDFQKARSFGVLSSLHPGASYFQLMKMQEQGAGQDGYLNGILGQLKREHGGGEGLAMGVMNQFGLQAGTSEKLAQLFERNPSALSSIRGPINDSAISNLLSVDNAKRNVPQNEQESAASAEAKLSGLASITAATFTNLTSTTKDSAAATRELTKAIREKYDNGIAGQ